jgi:hypothetical protein
MQNNRLNEQVKQQEQVLTEAVKNEKKERTESVKNASGRGKRVVGDEKIIAEFNNPTATGTTEDVGNIVEGTQQLDDLLYLSGVTKRK